MRGKRLEFESQKQKNAEKLQFFAEKFGHIKKKQYLCTRFRKEVTTVTNGIKAITSDFGSENLGSIPGWSTTKKPVRRAFFERGLSMCDGIRAATPTVV